ncbi:glutamate receptor ionotropic, delta-2-like [Folsomia candida]|nr:glutamate receptor ionotropic, delta-2-like [Folsomia candida]
MSTGRGSGLKLPNGTWIGTVGDVLSGKADVGITTAHTPDRIQAVSFTSSFMDVSYLVLVKGHGTQIFSLFAFLKPFDEVMWICLGISTLVAFLTFKMISEWMKRIHGTDSWTIQRQIGFILTSYLDQGFAPGIPKFTPLRCFIGLWFCFGIVITTIYKSKMVGLLAFPTLEQVPETFKELVDSEYQVGFPFHGNAAYNTLKASTNPVYVKLVKNMEIITGSGLDCLERVAKTDKSACILYLGSDAYLRAANLSDSDIRKLVYAPETVFNVFIGLILEPGSIYKEGFERWMSWTRPFHLPHLWNVHDLYYNLRLPKRAWWLETGQMDKLKTSVKETDVNLTLKHISGAFYFLVGCHLISSLHFTVEILWSRFKPFFKRFHKK